MRGRPFQKGKSGNPAGKPKGRLADATVEAREAAARIVDDPEYRNNLLARARRGDLNAGVEQMLWHYAKGKPKETHVIEGVVPVSVIERVIIKPE